ncbi:hypothetical protein LTR70_009371 [Exophiala xenobiotica]|uniref:Sulphur transport domain-containing protein n=1 Tax=Lithohypha guttulata TaxID=1690604 RepID=A0ABR0JXW5_9EURO|nr:hypothetical protein LTR24_009188 [Lithohypha guttulata]KAK5310578.1 hypothetical protein LTR70_009371 [Exophiala xenobiotica]
MASYTASLATGVTFGSALTLSGVAGPYIIINQFRLSDFHMLLTFLTASACSAATFVIARHTGFVKISCKKNNSFSWFGSFDGNIVGGLLMGIGMGLTGACPGTVLVQAAAGVSGSKALVVGGLLAGIVFVKWQQQNRPVQARESKKHSVPEIIGWSDAAASLSYEAALLSMILAASFFAPRGGSLLQPVGGGILIGLAQVLSVTAARKPLGVSSAYEDAGKTFWAFVDGKPTPTIESLTFAGGILIGARLMMQLVPKTLEVFYPNRKLSTPATLVGGFALIFGARMAGGCTSGHGISGMSLMSLSSFITVSCMFAGGILTALVV